MIAAIELAKQLRESQALVADLENQIAEGLAGMDQAEGRIAELEEALGLLIDEIGLSVPDQPQEFDANNFWRAFAKANQALSGDGSAFADVVREARELAKRAAKKIYPQPDKPDSDYAVLRRLQAALDKMDGKPDDSGRPLPPHGSGP